MGREARLRSFIVVLAVLLSAVVTPAALAISTTIVISEFRFRGTAGASDEFVEISNLSAGSVDISGWKLSGSNNAWTTSTRVTVPTGRILDAGCRYLFAGSTYSLSTTAAPNQTFSTGFADDGGVAILDAAGGVVDQAGLSVGSAYKEGTTLPAFTATNKNQSYERLPLGTNTTDTDNNANDFVYNDGTSNPQNLASTGCATTAVTLKSASVARVAGSVLVRWMTASEVDTLGFNVIRAGGGATVQVNRSLILASTSGRGASYRLVDRTARPGSAYTYVLQAVSLRGARSVLARSRLAG